MSRWRHLVRPGLLGLVIIGAYLATTTGILRSSNVLVLIPVVAIGPVAIVGMISIHGRLARVRDGIQLRAATVFLVVAFALFTLMLVIQQMVGLRFRDLQAQVGEPSVGLLRSIQEGVNLVQLGADVAFDIFYCLGMILLAGVLFRAAGFGRVLAAAGAIVAAGLLILNFASFPYVPAESGSIDLGPLTGVWWVLVILRLSRWSPVDQQAVARTAT